MYKNQVLKVKIYEIDHFLIMFKCLNFLKKNAFTQISKLVFESKFMFCLNID